MSKVLLINQILSGLKFTSDASQVLTRSNRYKNIHDVGIKDFLSKEDFTYFQYGGQINSLIEGQFKKDLFRVAEGHKKIKSKILEDITSKYIVVRDVDRDPDQKKSVRLVNKKTFEPLDVNAEQVLYSLKLSNKEMYYELLRKAPLVRFVFNFKKPSGFTGTLIGEVAEEFNTFVPQDLSHVKDIPLNPLFKEYMENLIPIEYQRKWMCSWAVQMATGTCDTAPILVGDMGTGKTSLMFLFSTFHRHEYVEVIRGSGLNSKFNANLEGKRLNCIDEFYCNTPESKANFKALFNTTVSIEAKGVDARKGKIAISHIATTNSTTDVHVEPRDRRMSVPDLNQAPIPPHIGEFIVPLGKRIDDNALTESDWENIKAFQKYVIDNQLPNFKSYEPIRGEMFREMFENNMGPIPYMVFAALREAPGIPIAYSTLKEAWDRKRGTDKTNFLSFGKLVSRLKFYLRDNETLSTDNKARLLTLEIKDNENN